MSEMGEALGTAVGGTLLARAAEPTAGDGGRPIPDGHTEERNCLNCDATLIGSHCHACGQRAHVHRTLGAFAHDLIHGVLHFEGKTWRTLPLLVWRPGKLTREYIDGRRASYVSPIALFLFVIFLSFAAFNLLGAGTGQGIDAGIAAAREAHGENTRELADLRKEKTRLTSALSARAAALDKTIEELEGEQRGLRVVLDRDATGPLAEIEAGLTEGRTNTNSALAKAIRRIRDNPQLAIYKAQTSAYKYSWALIPLSVPFVWLLFPFNRRYGAYDHTVFTTYSISFMIALVAVASFLIYLGWDNLGGLLLLYAPLHMYRQLRGTYALGRFGAIWRMLALSLFAWLAIGFYAALISVMIA